MRNSPLQGSDFWWENGAWGKNEGGMCRNPLRNVSSGAEIWLTSLKIFKTVHLWSYHEILFVWNVDAISRDVQNSFEKAPLGANKTRLQMHSRESGFQLETSSFVKKQNKTSCTDPSLNHTACKEGKEVFQDNYIGSFSHILTIFFNRIGWPSTIFKVLGTRTVLDIRFFHILESY